MFTLPTCNESFGDGVGKVAGFSLDAGVAVRADQRQKLERLCRYISRPAVSEKRLSLTPDHNVGVAAHEFARPVGSGYGNEEDAPGHSGTINSWFPCDCCWAMSVTFVLIDEDTARLEHLDPDSDWREFITGERAWILQTYLRLKRLGHPVRLDCRVPADGIAVFSAKHRRRLRRCRTAAVLVATREDVNEALIADFEILQNQSAADDVRRFMIPHWPQPGLLSRDSARGAAVSVIAFKGFLGNLHPDFQGRQWRELLAQEGLEFQADAVAYTGAAMPAEALAWNDYRHVDLILAVRPPRGDFYPRKPATKLYNAWHARVPALLGPEVAYRELRRDRLDYAEVSGREEAMAAIRMLRSDPGLYRRIVEHGAMRAREFTVEHIAARWADLLFREIPRLAGSVQVRRWRGKPLFVKEISRRLSRR